MSTVYKTPGVYVEEIPSLPASVAQVATAVPAFVGFTEMITNRGVPLKNTAVRVGSRVEFEALFGAGAPLGPGGATVMLGASGGAVEAIDIDKAFHLYDAIRLFYDNGGGACYIVSVGAYDEFDAGTARQALLDGLDIVARHDEPTLLVVPDAMRLDADGIAAVQQHMLKQCAELQDRFAVFDVLETAQPLDPVRNDVAVFREKLGINHLKYGAAYTPWLQVSYPSQVRFEQIALDRGGSPVTFSALLTGAEPEAITIPLGRIPRTRANIAHIGSGRTALLGGAASLRLRVQALADAARAGTADNTASRALADYAVALATRLDGWRQGTGLEPGSTLLTTQMGNMIGGELAGAWQAVVAALLGAAEDEADDGIGLDLSGLDVTALFAAASPWGAAAPAAVTPGDPADAVPDRRRALVNALLPPLGTLSDAIDRFLASAADLMLDDEKALYENWPVYRRIVDAIKRVKAVVPPSGAVVGAYAMVDRTRGVWKAPANVSLAGVVGLTRRVDDKLQADLNVDPDTGKSVNAIRAFSGKGILVWGARTLAGNDNEWRYVPVRRFFNMAEESIQKAMGPIVFEPNDANTWLRVKAMIENFQNGLWRAGALAGAKPEAAYFVNVGLGKTMTNVDILEGRMIVEIGLAVVRPAEFIVLKFSHKMQSA